MLRMTPRPLRVLFLALFFGLLILQGKTSRAPERLSDDGAVQRAAAPWANGVHTWTWAADSLRDLFDRWLPGWRADPFALRCALGIPAPELWEAHALAKASLLQQIEALTGCGLDPETLTVGIARRMTAYKRNTLVLRDLERLNAIARRVGGLQLVFAGKAHPRDLTGKEQIRDVFAAARRCGSDLRIVYVPDYDMDLARLLVGGVDLWLNTPRKPKEASGTSGMKAAVNGVPQLSTLDGWWLEGHVEGITGWSIGDRSRESGDDAAEAAELYSKLEHDIAPLFYEDRAAWRQLMQHAIAINGSFFTAHRMVQQYAVNAYFAEDEAALTRSSAGAGGITTAVQGHAP